MPESHTVFNTNDELNHGKSGITHVHILLFLHPNCKLPTSEDINKVICVEIPNKMKDSNIRGHITVYYTWIIW